MIIGQTLGHYRIVSRIGAGGMGVVYRAHDERLQRDVAIKVLPADQTEDKSRHSRLLHEARTASSLNHPNVCTIHEVGEASGELYIVMEFVEGQPLNALASQHLPVETVVRYGAQIANALAHAHSRNVIHRDLKTSNIVITTEGRAKVLDFGLAQRLQGKGLEVATQSQETLSESGRLAGTLAYMAPEILRGESADARTDIWALGVVLYELLAGELPFRGRTGFEVSSAILNQTAPPLSSRVPLGLRAVVERCLAKDPTQRYQQAGEVRAALEAIRLGSAAGSKPRVSPKQLDRSVIRSLAVLPLEDLSGSTDDYFADGMTEALIAKLAKISALRVTSRTSVMQFKGARKSLKEIARKLKVDAIVEGSVMRAGQRVRITAQLIHAASDSHLWAESYEREFQDILTLQSQVATAIATEVRVKVSPDEQARLAKAQRVHEEAYETYLKGRYLLNKRTEEEVQKAIGLFQRAIEMDASFPLAHAGLADAYTVMAGYEFRSPREALPLAKASLIRALEMDGDLAEARCGLASVIWESERDYRTAESEFRRALSLNPGSQVCHRQYAEFLTQVGRFDESLAEIQRAFEIDPLSLVTNAVKGWLFYQARQPERAARQLRETLELDGNFPIAHEVLGQVCQQQGRHAEAVAELEKAVELSGKTPLYLASLAHGYGLIGRTERANEILAELFRQSETRYVSPFFIAVVYAGLGDLDNAFQWLEKARIEGSYRFLYLRVYPIFDPLRADPRFAELLRRAGFPQT
jgi:serine/threonine protein kinase